MKTQRLVAAFLVLAMAIGFWSADAQEKDKEKDKDNPYGIVATLKGHTELVYSVAFNDDGKQIATGSFDNTIKLWDTPSGKEIRSFGGPAGHQKMVLTVAISPNGQLLASGSADNTLKVWDIPSTSPLQTLASNDGVTSLALSPDGKRLATGGKDGLIQLWDTATFKPSIKMPGHTGAVTSLAFSANNQFIASSGADKTLRFFDANKGQQLAEVGAHHGSANAVVLNPNSTVGYSIGDDGLLKFWQVPPPPTRTLASHEDSVLAIAFSPDGNQVFTAGKDKVIRQTPIAGGKETKSFAGASAAIRSAAVAPNNTTLAAGTAENNIALWNIADGKIIDQLQAHRGAVTGVSFNAQSTQMLTSGSDGLIKLWSLPLIPGKSLTHPESVLAAAATPDGKQVFTGSTDKIVRAWDPVKPAILRQFTGHAGPVTAVAVSANGQTLVSGSADQTIRVWNQAMGKETAMVGAHAGPVTSLTLNPAGNQVLSSSTDGSVKLWQVPTAGPRPFAHPDQVTSIAVSPDSTRVATGCADKQVRLWNFKTGAKERDLQGPALSVTSVAFSGNGQQVAAGSADKTATVWNVADGKLLKKIALPGVVNDIAFSPDGKSLAAALADNSVRVVNLVETKDKKDKKDDEPRNFAGHKGSVTSIAYTPKGDALISGSADKSVIIWELKDGKAAKTLEHPTAVSGLALSKDGTRLAVAGDKAVKIWTIADGKESSAFAAPDVIQSIAIAPDGKSLLLGGKDKVARLVDPQGRLLEFFNHDGAVQGVAFADARQLLTASADKLAQAWTSSLLWSKDVKAPVVRALLSPKGDLALAVDDKSVKTFSTADGKDLKTLDTGGAVVGLDLSADGTKVVTADADKTVKVWTAKDDKKPLSTLTLDAVPRALAVSPNGTRLAVAVGDDKSPVIRVYDLDSGRELQIIDGHMGPIGSIDFLADNKTIVSTSQDKSARLTSVGVLASIDGHKDGAAGVQFHSNGTQALSAGGDKLAKLWDLAKGTMLKSFGPVDDIKAVAFSRDYTQAGVAAGKKAIVWNIGDGKQLYELVHPADVLSLSFNQDKTRLATGAADKLARTWDIATAKELQFFTNDEPVAAVLFDGKSTGVVYAGGKTPRGDTLSIQRVVPVSPGPVHALVFAPNNTHVVTGGSDKQVKIWNINSAANERTFAGFGDSVHSVAVAKNNLLLAAGSADKTVRVFNFGDAKEMAAVKTSGKVTSLAFSANSLALAGGGAGGAVSTWDVTFQAGQPLPQDFLKPIQSFSHKEPVTRVEFAADNATIYASSLDKTLQAWKLASLTPTRNFPHPNHVDSVAFNAKGDQLISGGHDGKIRIFDLVKGVQLREINAHILKDSTMIYAVAYSPDGTKILSAGYDNSLKLWDANTGAMVKDFKAYKVKDFEKGHQDPVFSAAFSPDGKFIASGSGGLERLIKIWNVADGSVVRDLANPQLAAANPKAPPRSHPGWVYKLRFTKDGKLVSIGDAPMNKGYLAIWNPTDGKMLYGNAMPLGTFFGLAISPDQKLLAIGAGPRGRASPDFNSAYLMQWPLKDK